MVLASALACAASVAAEDRKSTLGVSVRVTKACSVTQHEGRTLGVRCTRGSADRVLVAAPHPRLVTLLRDGSRLRDDVPVPDGEGHRPTGDAVITIQF
jgi:hypothetical protein